MAEQVGSVLQRPEAAVPGALQAKTSIYERRSIPTSDLGLGDSQFIYRQPTGTPQLLYEHEQVGI